MKSTIYQVSVLIESAWPASLQPLRELIDTVLTDLDNTAKELLNLETEVEQLEESLALKKKVLEYIRAKTKIQQ
jgi:hypothetical protein